MNYILFGAKARNHMLPFTFLRPLADIRVGMLTIREKWEAWLNSNTSSLTEPYLAGKYPMVKEADNMLINASVMPDPILLGEISELQPNQTLVSGETLIAHRVPADDVDNMDSELLEEVEPKHTQSQINKLFHLWDILVLNERQILADYDLITKNRESQPVPQHVKVINPENVFIEEGARLDLAMINASMGPVYIGKNAHVMDGAMLRGPVGVGEGSVIRMGAKIYGGSAIGPHCKVGGEMEASVIFGYSNKAHEGYLGHSVIGEWCNIGADTNTSNLKINYDQIRLWDYAEESFVPTGQTFCGTFMGDHTKCGINTMFNTGTVIGVSSQIFGAGYMRNFIPSFSWGSVSGLTVIDFEKAVDVAERMYKRRGKEFSETDLAIFRHVYEHTLGYRKIL